MELMPKDPTEACEPIDTPWTELDPYRTIPGRISEAELEAMWNLNQTDFEIWKSKQVYQNWKLIDQAEEKEKRKTEEASAERKARKEAKRQENPKWGTWT